MRKILTILAMLVVSYSVYAQDVQQAAADAAKAMMDAPAEQQKVEKPKYWAKSLKTQVNVGQTSLTNWAAGGDNTISLQGFIDANANWKKNEMFWNNRLQLDYGFLYASSKPILQKSTDRIYLESKWGYNVSKDVLYLSANYDFKSQFTTGYTYKTPAVPDEDRFKDESGNIRDLDDLERKDQVDLWRNARVPKSNFLAPAYTNLALGIDYKPTKWLSVNFAPLTGGFVIVKDAELRKSYSMELKKEYETMKAGYADVDPSALTGNDLAAYERYKAAMDNGEAYRGARFEFGAQLKVDAKVNINDNFSYSTQVVLFSNYLDKPQNMRVNWDNRLDWKLAKYFSFTLTTNLIYDDKIMIKNDKDIDMYPNGRQRVQFKESLAFGFTYTIASKK
ncbi:MAG: DUF3078 domain-containing protein [Bacteroidales bacterium]|nr:DUF3078 domain-containing protein [Bacteroidales bacterium]